MLCNAGLLQLLKQGDTFIKAGDMSEMLINGQVGEVDGVKIIKIPSSYFRATRRSCLSGQGAAYRLETGGLQDYNNPRNNGWLIEGESFMTASFLTKKGYIRTQTAKR